MIVLDQWRRSGKALPLVWGKVWEGVRTRALAAVLLAAFVLSAPAQAVEPDEVLADPALEARARALSKELRCLVCRNESIDDSSAELARDLRLLVRERLVAGDSDAEVIRYLVDRYGEFVLLRPPLSVGNAALWAAGPVIFLLGLGACILFLRARRPTSRPDAPLSEAERAEMERLIRRD